MSQEALAENQEMEAPEAQTTDTFVESSQEAMGQDNVADRPEWLPEKFETPEQLAHSYSDLERAFHSRRDEIRNEVMNELSEEHDASVPASPGDYDMTLRDGEVEVPLPETPMTEWFREKAHQLGLGQDQFQDIVAEYMNVEALSGPAWEDEAMELGEYADMRLDRVASWAKASLSDRAYEVFASIPASAGMVQCFEELMELNGQPAFNMMESGYFQEEISEDDLKSMQNDPRYWRDKDPAFIQKVRAGFTNLAAKKHGR